MSHSAVTKAEIEGAIRNVSDFPKPGIQFKDITPVIKDPRIFSGVIDCIIGDYKPGDLDSIIGIDARGFIFAAAVALRLQAGFVPIRKKGKLPYETHEESYELEYGTSSIEIHTDAVVPGERVLLIDDLLATGGTAAAASLLLGKVGADIREIVFFIELGFLKGRDKFGSVPVRSIVNYS
jgi:adenine phosphoribosyltransferase